WRPSECPALLADRLSPGVLPRLRASPETSLQMSVDPPILIRVDPCSSAATKSFCPQLMTTSVGGGAPRQIHGFLFGSGCAGQGTGPEAYPTRSRSVVRSQSCADRNSCRQ